MNLWVRAFIITLPSFLYGYILASLNTCFEDNEPGSLLNDINLSTTLQELATALTLIGAWVGSGISSYPAEKMGVRRVILLNNILFIIGGVMTSALVYEEALFLGRLILGFATGIESMVVPVLLAEASPPELRGRITLLHQLQVTIGIFVAGVMGYGLVVRVDHGWRYVQGFIVIPAVVQILLAWTIPESPRWLIRKDRIDDARSTLRELRGPQAKQQELDDELEGMRKEFQEEATVQDVAWKEVFAVRRPLTIGFGLLFFQAMTGINSVIFYSTKIFSFAGVSQSILATVSVGIVNVLMTIVSVFLVDRLGRRILLQAGTCLMAGSLLLDGIVLLALNSDETVQGAIAVVGVLLYVSGFAVGLGAVSWVVMNEVVPSRIRKKASSLFIAQNFAVNIAISLLTLTTIEGIGGGSSDSEEKRGTAILFLIFCGISVVTILFITSYVPETKGMSLEDLKLLMADQPLSNRQIQKTNGAEEGGPLLHSGVRETDAF